MTTFQLARSVFVVSGVALLAAGSAQAQIVPDASLGLEGSLVTPGVLVEDAAADLIEGGAIRGSNLFHSFLEFNVDSGQRVYFANPSGVESILSRVTGANPSNIFGTLEVDGAADLFLINPNGLVFGETAALDIEGSFYATTAAAIPLGDGVYSATEPAQSSLLTVSPSALFSSYLTQASGDIENRGQLAAQGNLTLAGNRLDLQGQVAAGGDLTLLGNTVQIRDAADTPFVGFAGGDLLVQGNERVDIVALSHPDSGLYSYGDMVLRSASPVGGDAHYFSGGSFRVESLDESLGELFSPIDPVIRALGDVEIFSYRGGSLHILAGGSVNIGTAIITDADPGEIGVDFLRETITLSDGTVVQVAGGAQPTLDVRAGVLPVAVGLIPPGNVTGLDPTFLLLGFDVADGPTSADITVGDVLMAAPDGLVLLTTQYQPNVDLAGGTISITGTGIYGDGIDARGFGGQGGAVYIDAYSNVFVTNSTISTLGAGAVGDVVINAGGTVRFERQNRPTGVASNLTAGVEGAGGSIQITATDVEVLNGAQLLAITLGNGDAGNVEIEAQGRVVFDGGDAFSRVEAGATGAGGDVSITANSLEVLNGAQLTASTLGNGAAGNVEIEAQGRVVFDDGDAFSRVADGATGAGGDVLITANSLEVLNGAQLLAITLGNGDAGNVEIEAQGRVVFDGRSADGQFGSAAFSSVEAGATGAGGDVSITANSLEVLNGAALTASISGNGAAGNVEIEAQGRVVFDGGAAFSRVEAGATGAGGDVSITANSLEVLNGAQLTASTLGNGAAGNVEIEAQGRVVFDDGDAFSRVADGATGAGGDVLITANSLEVLNGALLSASTLGNGDAGNVEIEAQGRVVFDGTSADGRFASAAFSRVEAGATGAGGDVSITANSLEVLNGALLSASTLGNGDAGNVEIEAQGRVVFDGGNAFSSVEAGATGTGGDVSITANSLEVLNGAALLASTLGNGDAGNVEIHVDGRMRVTNGEISSLALEASGGRIDIRAGNLILSENSNILTLVSFGEGSGGNITIIADFVIALDDSDILAFSVDGQGGDIDLSRTTFFGQNATIGFGSLTREELLALDGNSRVDINASGGVEAGQIAIGDSSFIENSLTSLADTIVDTSSLTAGSCIARTSDDSLGSFVATGSGGLPQRPGDTTLSTYPTGTVRAVAEPTSTPTVQEPDGVYQLADGRLVLSRQCE